MKLIIKEIIIAKCQNCVLTQTFGLYNPSSVWKITVKIRNIFNYVKRKSVFLKRSARTVQKNLKLMLRASGCKVPPWKISLISSCLRRMLEPRHKRIPRTWTSVILWPAELKCCATGYPGVLLRTLRKCSPIRLLRLRPVSPMKIWEHLRQEIQYTWFSEVQVKWSRTVKMLLGPRIIGPNLFCLNA